MVNFFDVKLTQIANVIPRLFFQISKYFQLLFFMGQSPDAMCKVSCESEKSAWIKPPKSFLFLCFSEEKKYQAEVGVAYMKRCSSIVCTRGYV